MTKIGRYVEYEETMSYLQGYAGGDCGDLYNSMDGIEFDGFDDDCYDEREFTVEDILEAEKRGVHPYKLVAF